MTIVRQLVRLVPRRGTVPEPRGGEGHDRAVGFVHGSVGSSGTFEAAARAVQAAGIPSVGVDYARRGLADLGHGEQQLAEAVRDVLRHVPVVDLVGHSLGGYMAFRLAARPEFAGRIRSIVGLGAAFKGMPVTGTRLQRRVIRWLVGPSFDQLIFEVPPSPDKHIHPDLMVVSVVSDADTVVPRSSSNVEDIGRVVHVDGVEHGKMTDLVAHILEALDIPSAHTA